MDRSWRFGRSRPIFTREPRKVALRPRSPVVQFLRCCRTDTRHTSPASGNDDPFRVSACRASVRHREGSGWGKIEDTNTFDQRQTRLSCRDGSARWIVRRNEVCQSDSTLPDAAGRVPGLRPAASASGCGAAAARCCPTDSPLQGRAGHLLAQDHDVESRRAGVFRSGVSADVLVRQTRGDPVLPGSVAAGCRVCDVLLG